MVGSGDEPFFLRMRKKTRTLQMKVTLRATVEMRKRMKKLMMIFAVS